MLAKALCDEGATVLVLPHEAWLDVPKEYPDGLPVKNLLFFIDNLNFHCSKQALTPLAEKVHFAPQPTFQQRLQQTLDWFEQACGEREIRVVATACNEADEWAKLQYNEEDPLWSRFTLFELPPPEDEAVTALLADLTDTLDIACDPSEFPAMAACNDQTMANVITNLRLAASRGHLTLDDYRPTLEGGYEECYLRAQTLGPAVEPIYDALEVMQDIGIVPHRHLVIPLATRLWGGNFFQRLGRRYHIARTLDQLLTRKILPARNSVVAPRDGQLEGRGRKLDRPFPLDILSKIIIDASRRRRDPLTESLQALALHARSTDNSRVAVRAATRLLQVTPGDPLALLLRADCQLALNAPNLSLADADMVLASDAAPHLLTEGHCVRGRALAQMDRNSEALAELSTVLEREPEHLSAYLNRATVLVRLDRPHSALRDLNKAISAQDNWAEALYARAAVRHKLGHYRAALRDLNQVISLKPDLAIAYVNRGAIYGELGEHDKTIQDADKAISLQPDLAEAYFTRAEAHYNLEQYQRALQDLDNAISLKPDWTEAFFDRAMALRRLGRPQEAITDLTSAIKLDPKLTEGYCIRGQLVSDPRHAIWNFNRVIELDPNHVSAYANRAICLAKLGKYADALVDCEKSIQLDPTDAHPYYNLACIHSLTGRTAEAFEALSQAIDLDAKYREDAKTDSDFDNIREDPRFKELVGE